MKIKSLATVLLSSVLLIGSFTNLARAGIIQVGTLSSSGDCTIYCTPLLQQVYSSSNFSSDLNISSISFFAGAGSWGAGNNYEMWLSYFVPGVGNLTNDWTTNLGPSAILFDTIQLTSTTQGQAVMWDGNFSYDFSEGDLLVSVRNTGSTAGPSGMYASSDGSKQRAYSRSSDENQPMNVSSNNYGLVTQFNTGVSVPEPSTLAIFALGMIGLASRRFKKQS